MNLIIIILIAISLSMDAFSLALAYGTNNLRKKEIYILSVIVGVYHFLMPIIGCFLGNIILSYININENIIVFIIFEIIGINMIIDSFKSNTEIKKMKLIEMIIFGLAVSLDSFSIGIGLKNISDNILLCSFIFSFTSSIFTYLGIILGKKLNKLVGHISTFIGGTIIIIFGLMYMFN